MKIFIFNRVSLFIAGLLVVATGCKKDWLDINDNPNAALTADPSFLFAGAATDFSANRTAEIGLAGAFWGQVWASGNSAGVFSEPERYSISIFTTGNTWRSHYPNSQKNLIYAIQIAEASEIDRTNEIAQCQILSAMIFYNSSILWEDVPYSQAVNVEFPAPAFDLQPDVLNGVISDLMAAEDSIDFNNPLVIDDFYYGGDMAKWERLARSLRFRTALLMAKNDPSKVNMLSEMLSEGNMVGPGDDAEFPFFDAAGNLNPIYNLLQVFAGGSNLFYYAPQTTVELMQDLNDPRLLVYFTSGTEEEDEIIPVAPGESFVAGESATVNTDIILPDMPERVYTYSEQLFLEAEAYLLYLNDPATADQKLREAITESMTYYGISPADIETYLTNSIPDLSSISQEEAKEVIATQSWFDLFQRPIEAWTMWRKLKYPELQVPTGAQLGDIIRRLPYPPDEVNSNPNAPAQKPLDQEMWFE